MTDDPKASREGEDATKAGRSGRCAIVGRPNVGKSTLLNTLLGQKLAIATAKPGTTRLCMLGVYVSDEPPTQIAFVDTPGFARPKSALGKILVEQAQLGLTDADVVVFITEAPKRRRPSGVLPPDEPVLELLEEAQAPVVLAINKVDALKDKSLLLPFITAYRERLPFAAVVPISARKGTHLDQLVAEIRLHLPEGLMYDEDLLTDRPERFFAAELIREAVIEQTRQEVPHGCAVMIDRYAEEPHRVMIDATIVVEKDSHKGIVIGARGSRIKAIGTDARHEIERFLERPVVLKLWVKVVQGWTGKPTDARRLTVEMEGS